MIEIEQKAFDWMRAAVNVSHGRWPESDLTEAKAAFMAAVATPPAVDAVQAAPEAQGGADARRLDWLQAYISEHASGMELYAIGQHDEETYGRTDWIIAAHPGEAFQGATFRDAIDAGMSATSLPAAQAAAAKERKP